MKVRIFIYAIMAAALSAISCTDDILDPYIDPSGVVGTNPGDRAVSQDTRKVLLLYSAGYNDLQAYLKEDIQDLLTGWAPEDRRNEDVILVYTHQSRSRSDLKTPTEPVLFKVYADNMGQTVTDTLVRYPSSTISASAGQLNEVLAYVRDNFPAKSYGMIFSSHATGFLPAGYYNKPEEYVFNEDVSYRQGIGRRFLPTSVPYIERISDPSMPEVKSIGQSVSEGLSYEMDLKDFAEAIPMKLDYIIFDACLMGGIEVAYELAGKCGSLAFSQAEVLAEGLNYKTVATHLLGNKSFSDPESVCKDYFTQYDQKTGISRSATISLIDCDRLEPLAEICKELFSRHRESIADINAAKVQRFYRGSHHWFYDLESILMTAGITADELARLHEALDGCVLYKGYTPSFLGEFDINVFSGFSMYLPCNGSEQLDRYYKTLEWNKATGLIE